MRHLAQRKDIRDLILDAVDVLPGRYGCRRMTMEEVARVAGIGNEELVLAHVDRIADLLIKGLLGCLKGQGPRKSVVKHRP
jgi:hypothetical protein